MHMSGKDQYHYETQCSAVRVLNYDLGDPDLNPFSAIDATEGPFPNHTLSAKATSQVNCEDKREMWRIM